MRPASVTRLDVYVAEDRWLHFQKLYQSTDRKKSQKR